MVLLFNVGPYFCHFRLIDKTMFLLDDIGSMAIISNAVQRTLKTDINKRSREVSH